MKKSIFAATQVEFLGFHKDGIKPTCEKVEAIQKAPPPQNKTELQAFLGPLNFYSCFLPNKTTVLEPLHCLLDQPAIWQWEVKHKMPYVQVKQSLQTDKMLAHYDGKKPLAVVCDASPYGLGALLFQLECDGQEKPICFASRTMTTTERSYAQIDKEALPVVFAVRKFHQYSVNESATDHCPESFTS
uniref:Reverse transcriptase/retrotransposon-derived protein RNase H-like domain-containing protein n=1 Tax=Cyprinus carpio TaxID=7962 RepID=A0A8C1TTS7_CYPCA